jgi:hypothetical protein
MASRRLLFSYTTRAHRFNKPGTFNFVPRILLFYNPL